LNPARRATTGLNTFSITEEFTVVGVGKKSDIQSRLAGLIPRPLDLSHTINLSKMGKRSPKINTEERELRHRRAMEMEKQRAAEMMANLGAISKMEDRLVRPGHVAHDLSYQLLKMYDPTQNTDQIAESLYSKNASFEDPLVAVHRREHIKVTCTIAVNSSFRHSL